MSEIEELYENFPTILKEKLRNKEIEFPSNTKFDYEKIWDTDCEGSRNG